jgi:hypothetical protein
MSERVRFITHRETPILAIDFSRLEPADVPAVIEQARSLIHKSPPQSLLTLTDVTELHFDHGVTEAMHRYADSNRPFVRAAALVGVTGLKQVIFNTVKRLTGRRLQAFDDVAAAKEWLLDQRVGS